MTRGHQAKNNDDLSRKARSRKNVVICTVGCPRVNHAPQSLLFFNFNYVYSFHHHLTSTVKIYKWVITCVSLAACDLAHAYFALLSLNEIKSCTGRRKEYAIRSEPVLVSIGLTEGDTVSHESGIDDTSDRFSSRGPSSNNLLELDIKSESLDGKDKFTHRHSYQWNKKPYLQLVKLLLFILYNVYLIVGVNRTWSKVRQYLLMLPVTVTFTLLCLIKFNIIINTLVLHVG